MLVINAGSIPDFLRPLLMYPAEQIAVLVVLCK